MVENGTLSLNESNSEQDTADSGVVLPLNCQPLAHQVAGHFYGKGKTKLGLLQTVDGLVLKPVQSPPRGEREHNFFKKLFLSDESALNQDEVELKSLLPTYRGSYSHNDIVYIKMDDIGYRIKNPAVIDFKIGRITHDPEATVEKIDRQKKKYPAVERIGFQLIGMRVFDETTGTFTHFDKIFGRSLSEEDIIHGLALYYQFHQIPQIRAIQETIAKFEQVLKWFEKQKTYHFFSSSLIVVYEADLERALTSANDDNNNTSNQRAGDADAAVLPSDLSDSVRIVMADFAHVFPAQDELDENYAFGLRHLIKHLKLLLQPDYKFKDVRKYYGNNAKQQQI